MLNNVISEIEKTKQVVDEYDNIFEIKEKLSSGGQGIIYRTNDSDLALKFPFKLKDDIYIKDDDIEKKIENLFLLNLPKNIQITYPLSILKNNNINGYVMKLLSDMNPIDNVFMKINYIDKIKKEQEKNIRKFSSNNVVLQYFNHEININYYLTGAAKSRFYVLFKLACILERLHSFGIVYGDLSFSNIFVSKDIMFNPQVYLIDSDNLQLESICSKNKQVIYTPQFAAPEIIYNGYGNSSYTDIWSFAVVAFYILFNQYPFESQEEDWIDDKENEFSFIFDTQEYYSSLADVLLTDNLKKFFEDTLKNGIEKPYIRTRMAFWALEFAHAHDESVICPKCKMSYLSEKYDCCPYCDEEKPLYIVAENNKTNWKYIIQPKKCEKCGEYHLNNIYNSCPCCKYRLKGIEDTVSLPNRLYDCFSFENCDNYDKSFKIDFNSNIKEINLDNFVTLFFKGKK